MNKGCPKCGRMVDSQVDVCPYCGYKFSEIERVYKMAINGEEKKVSENAGLIQRLTAFNFDMLIMFVIFLGLCIINPLEGHIDFINVNIVYALITLIIYFIYSVVLEATPLKGTIGTRLLNLQVVDEGGYQIGFAMAFKHNIFKILNILTVGIGYLALHFTKHKQSLAEYFSDTYVENRRLEYNTKLYYANLFLRFLAFIIDILILNLIYFVIGIIINYLYTDNYINNITQISIIITMIMTILSVAYFTVLDSKGGTFGKKLFSFEVTNLNGENIGMMKSFVRVLLFSFESLLMPIGILVSFVWPTKQTFKDLVTKTVVIKKVLYK